MYPLPDAADEQTRRAAAGGRGRFARNAVVQGAAAELFKAWAVTVRAGLRGTGAGIVLCLHDELLVHAPVEASADVQELLRGALADVGARWAPGVRFVADISELRRWSDAG
jgi:DNA polymerase-1